LTAIMVVVPFLGLGSPLTVPQQINWLSPPASTVTSTLVTVQVSPAAILSNRVVGTSTLAPTLTSSDETGLGPTVSTPVGPMPSSFACIAYYESRYESTVINPTSGDAGVFQIAQATWNEYRTSNDPWWIPSATPAQQLAVAKRIQAADGWSPWVTAPLCGL